MAEGERLTRNRDGLVAFRRSLPVFSGRNEFLRLVEVNRVLVVLGETGSGKTTQIPQYLFEAGYAGKHGCIAVTQPRRIAAVTVARRVASERGVEIGDLVGYSVRFDEHRSEKTRIVYLTDGMLLREALIDPLFGQYNVIVLDEAHERTVNTDTLLGVLKSLLRKRDDLRVIVMSATLDAERFSSFFDDALIVYFEGRQHRVDIFYTEEPIQDYLDAAINTVVQIHLNTPPGDVLVFLTGQDEIESMEYSLKEKASRLPEDLSRLFVIPIFAALDADKQLRVFEPAPKGSRKIVLATNIAETSVTISGIRYVVDTGLCKVRYFSPTTGMESLVVVPISLAQAHQRGGRAGRDAPGVCFRLAQEVAYRELAPAMVPEIQRCNLASVMLSLCAFGVKNPLAFEFIDPPPRELMEQALTDLVSLGALNATMAITSVGRSLSSFPIDPSYAKVLVSAGTARIDAATMVAMLSGENIFHTPFEGREAAKRSRTLLADSESDHLTLIHVFRAFRRFDRDSMWCRENFVNRSVLLYVEKVRKQLLEICRRMNLPVEEAAQLLPSGRFPDVSRVALLKALLAGCFRNVAVLDASSPRGGALYHTVVHRQRVGIHPSSVLFRVHPPPACVVFGELVHTSKRYMRTVSAIDASWLFEVVPVFAREHERTLQGAMRQAPPIAGSAPRIRGYAVHNHN